MENEVGAGFMLAPRNAEAAVPHCVMQGNAFVFGLGFPNPPSRRAWGSGGAGWSCCSILPALQGLPASLREKHISSGLLQMD